MSLALALWLMAAVWFIAWHLGRRRGRAEYARYVLRELGPLLPVLEQLRKDEAEFERLTDEQMKAIATFRNTARFN